MFAIRPRDFEFDPRQIHTKDLKMVVAVLMLNIQQQESRARTGQLGVNIM